MPSLSEGQPAARSFHFCRPDAHSLHVRLAGPAGGEPWLVLHGGPGSGCSPAMLAWFDLGRDRVVLPDQRGAGRSRPAGTLRRNTVTALLADLEALRARLGIAQWNVVGGSWGAALALAYAARFPEAVSRLVLRGSFLVGWDDILALFAPRARGLSMLRRVAPDGERLAGARAQHGSVTRAMLMGSRAKQEQVAQDWQWVERRRLGMRASHQRSLLLPEREALRRKYRVQAHYLQRRAGLGKAVLLAAAAAIGRRGLPVTLLHGKADRVCSPGNARRLLQAMPHARMQWMEGGHLASGAMARALAAAIRGAPEQGAG